MATVNGSHRAPRAREWLDVMVEVEHAWQDYSKHARLDDLSDRDLGRLWLRLWLAERKRDALVRDYHAKPPADA